MLRSGIFYTIRVFLTFYAVLSKNRFEVTYALFLVKYYGSIHVCVKKLSFCMPDCALYLMFIPVNQ